MGANTWLAAFLVGAPPADMDRDVFELAWSAPDECPQRANVVGAVERLLGDLEPQEDKVHASGRVKRSKQGFALTLEIRSGGTVGERAITGESCAELTDAAALILAIAINPKVLERDPEPPTPPEPEEEPSPEASGEPEPPLEPEPEPAPAPPRRPALVMRAGAGLGAFLLPGPTASVSIAVGTAGRFWRVEAEGGYWFARETARDDGVTGRFQLGWAGLRGCGVPERGAFEFPLCAGLDAGAMRGEGLGDPLATTRTQNAIWLAARGGPSFVWRGNDWVGLWLAADAILPLLRPVFVTQPSGREVYRVNPAGLQVHMGVEFRPF